MGVTTFGFTKVEVIEQGGLRPYNQPQSEETTPCEFLKDRGSIAYNLYEKFHISSKPVLIPHYVSETATSEPASSIVERRHSIVLARFSFNCQPKQ